MSHTLPFSFPCRLLVPLAGRVAALLGDPFGEMEMREEPWSRSGWVATHRDARGHVVHIDSSYESVMPAELKVTARIEGLPGGVTVTFEESDVDSERRIGGRCEITGPPDAARAVYEAWSRVLFEAASDAELTDEWGAPPGWEERARACLRGAARCSFERIEIPRGYGTRSDHFGSLHGLYVFGEQDKGPRLCAGFSGVAGSLIRISPVLPAPRGSAYAQYVSAHRIPPPPRTGQLRAGEMETVEIHVPRVHDPRPPVERAAPRTWAPGEVPSLADLVGLYDPPPASPPAEPIAPANKPPVVPDFEADGFVAAVYGAGPWRVQAVRSTRGGRTLALRVQDEEGAAPSGFLDWGEYGYGETMTSLFIGEEQGVRAAASRLMAWLDSQGWKAAYGPEG